MRRFEAEDDDNDETAGEEASSKVGEYKNEER